MSGTFWSIEEIEPIIKERNELRQRVKEDGELIEAQKREILVLQGIRNEAETLRQQMAFYDNKCSVCNTTLGLLAEAECPLCKARQRVAELEDERDIFKRTLDKRDKQYEERGERMKAMRAWMIRQKGYLGDPIWTDFLDANEGLEWFDPETGEPL